MTAIPAARRQITLSNRAASRVLPQGDPIGYRPSYVAIARVSELTDDCATIAHPWWRLVALSSLLPVARTLGISCARISSRITACSDQLTRRSPVHELLYREIAERARSPELPARSLLPLLTAASRPGPTHLSTILGLLAAGSVARARTLAAETRAPDSACADKLARTGVLVRNGGRQRAQFLASLDCADEFPPSLALARALVYRIVSENRPHGDGTIARSARDGHIRDARIRDDRIAKATAICQALPAKQRKKAGPLLTVLAYCRGGVAAAVDACRSLAPQRTRDETLSLVVRAALEGRHFVDAAALVEHIAANAFREQAHVYIAAAMCRRGLDERARRALAEIRSPHLADERALLQAHLELNAGRWRSGCRILAKFRRPPVRLRDRGLLGLARPAIAAAGLACGDLTAGSATIDGLEVDSLAVDCALLMLRGAWLSTQRLDDKVASIYTRQISGLADMIRKVSGSATVAAAIATVPGDPNRLLGIVRDALGAWSWPALQSGHIRCQAQTIDTRPAADSCLASRYLAAGLRGVPASALAITDARSLARAYYDEGRILSPDARRHRKAIWRASRGAVRDALWQQIHGSRDTQAKKSAVNSDRPESRVDYEAARVRLRILVQLGGARIVDATASLVNAAPCTSPLYGDAFAALTQLDPRRAAHVFVTRFADIAAADHDTDAMAYKLEARGAAAPGFARAWSLLAERAVAELGRSRANAWMHTLVTTWMQRSSSLPGPQFVRGALSFLPEFGSVTDASPRTGLSHLARLIADVDALLLRSPIRLVSHLTAHPDDLARLRWLYPASLAPE